MENDHAYIASIFPKCLVQCMNVDLWLTYISETKIVNEGNPESYSIVSKVFSFIDKPFQFFF